MDNVVKKKKNIGKSKNLNWGLKLFFALKSPENTKQ